MESFLTPFWMPIYEHSRFNSQQLLFSFVLLDLQALKHSGFQLLLPEFVWPADTPFQISKPDLMYSSWSGRIWSMAIQLRRLNN